MARYDFKKATIKIKDGTAPTPNELEITIGEGNLTLSEKHEREYMLDRGVLDTVRDGDESPLEVSLDAALEYFTGRGANITVGDAMLQRGMASDWVSTDDDVCAPYAVDIEITYLPTPSDCGDMEVVTLPDFRVESEDIDLRNATIAFSGKCNVITPTAVRTEQGS